MGATGQHERNNAHRRATASEARRARYLLYLAAGTSRGVPGGGFSDLLYTPLPSPLRPPSPLGRLEGQTTRLFSSVFSLWSQVGMKCSAGRLPVPCIPVRPRNQESQVPLRGGTCVVPVDSADSSTVFMSVKLSRINHSS